MLKGHNLFIFKARTLKIIYYHNSVIIEARTLKFCMIITHYFTLFKNSVKFLVTISCPSPISDDLLCPPSKKIIQKVCMRFSTFLHCSKSHYIIKLKILFPWIAIIWMPKNANQLNYIAKTFKTHFPVFQKCFKLFISQYEETCCTYSLHWYRLFIKERVCIYCLQCYRLFIKSSLINFKS